MDGITIGYTRVPTDEHDLPAEGEALLGLGVEPDRLFSDRGLTGTNRPRPGLREAIAASRARRHSGGDQASPVGPVDIRRGRHRQHAHRQTGLTQRERTLYDPADPSRRVLFDTPELAAGFDADLMRMRTREGLALAKAKGRLRGRQPKLTALQQRHLLELHDGGEHSQAEIVHLFGISETTMYRAIRPRRPETISTVTSP